MRLRWMPGSDGCHGPMRPPRRLVGLGRERWWRPLERRRSERWWRSLERRRRERWWRSLERRRRERWWQPMTRRRRERWWRPLVRRGRRGVSECQRWWRWPMRSLGSLATPGRWRRRWPMMDGGADDASVLECRGARESGGEGGPATVMRERGGDGRLERACQPAEIGPPLLHELREEHSSSAHEAVGVA